MDKVLYIFLDMFGELMILYVYVYVCISVFGGYIGDGEV